MVLDDGAGSKEADGRFIKRGPIREAREGGRRASARHSPDGHGKAWCDAAAARCRWPREGVARRPRPSSASRSPRRCRAKAAPKQRTRRDRAEMVTDHDGEDRYIAAYADGNVLSRRGFHKRKACDMGADSTCGSHGGELRCPYGKDST